MFVTALMGFLIKECGLNGEKCGCCAHNPSIFECLMNWSRLQCLIKWRIVVNSILECILTICKLISNAIWTFIFSVNGFFSSFFANGLSRLSSDACLSWSHSNKRHLPSVETNNHVPPERWIRWELKRTSPQNPQMHKHQIFRIHSATMSRHGIIVIKCMPVFANDFSHSTKNRSLFTRDESACMAVLTFKEIIEIFAR